MAHKQHLKKCIARFPSGGYEAAAVCGLKVAASTGFIN